MKSIHRHAHEALLTLLQMMACVSYVIRTCDPAHWSVYVTSVTMAPTRGGALFVGDQGCLMLTTVKNVLFVKRT